MTIIWSPGMALEDAEKLIIKRAISFYGSEERAAHCLRISMKEIQKKMKKYKEDEEKIEERRRQEKIKENEFVARSRGIPSL